jgi:hypothetical protein
MLCSIWRARNACMWENKQVSPVTTCVLASDMMHDLVQQQPHFVPFTYSRDDLVEITRDVAKM